MVYPWVPWGPIAPLATNSFVTFRNTVRFLLGVPIPTSARRRLTPQV